jgi:serine phosphatase RsbU (regulator of sigma subunit)
MSIMNLKYLILTLLLSCTSLKIFSTNVDSLLLQLTTTNDTAYINTLVRLADQYIYLGKMPEAEKCLEEAAQKNVSMKSKFSEVFIALKMALFRYKKSEFRLSYELCEEILLTAIELNDKNRIGECKTYMGMNSGRLGDFKKALGFYQEALPLFEATNNIPGQMRLYSNIAGVYFDQLDYKMAIEYFKKTLGMAIKTNDKKIIGQTYNNIGSAVQNSGNSKEAKEYYLKAAEINLNAGNKNNLGYNYMNLASCELEEDDTEKAREYNGKALKIFTDFKDPYSIVSCLCVEGDICIKEKKLKKAVEVFEQAVKLCSKIRSPILTERTYRQMANAYELSGDLNNAILFYKKHMSTKDSIVNDEIREEVTKKQLYYEFDKKHLSDSLESDSKQKYLQQEVDYNMRRASLQRNISVISLLSLLIVGALAFLIYRGLQKNKLANKLIEEKNKEILDSFYYAKKIQNALLPPIELMKESLPESFVLFKPKDIVSGDFYWMHRVNSETILIAVGDCTGHGVPGAMVSVVCSNALNRAAKEFGLTDPGKILDKVRELVIENFSESKSEVKDGMDISLCKIDIKNIYAKRNIKVEWAGANNPLWYTIGNCIIEISADKQPIGNAERAKPFTTNEIELQTNEMLYLFTDGYADQFGGEKGKKFKYRPLQDALIKNHTLNMDQQRNGLETVFENWKGNLEQVDDVCIIGIRL